MAYTGQLYQLWGRPGLNRGAYVTVNGPHDTYGVIQGTTVPVNGVGLPPPHPDSVLYLIRGVPARKGERSVAQF